MESRVKKVVAEEEEVQETLVTEETSRKINGDNNFQ